jgi:hypothetical protein
MTTEDSSFYSHRGFIPREFRTALIRDLEAGYFKYGASSITMQMVKNVLLHREKTLSRKFQELFLTWHLERKLEKDRIMEIYVIAIEYGPALYGIKPAAEVYFGTHNENQMLATWEYDNGVYGVATTGPAADIADGDWRLVGTEGVMDVHLTDEVAVVIRSLEQGETERFEYDGLAGEGETCIDRAIAEVVGGHAHQAIRAWRARRLRGG